MAKDTSYDDELGKNDPDQEADGYFDMDDTEDDELDLSFLDEEEKDRM